jgi:hypothetical protein
MNVHSACRALLSGATLLAATAMAANDVQPKPPVSPCLGQQQAAADGQPPSQQQQHALRSPCHLADAEKPEESSDYIDDVSRHDVQQRLDRIEMANRLGTEPDSEHQLPWIAPADRGYKDTWQHPADSIGLANSIPAVPEPAEVTMLVIGLALLAGVAARRRRQP